MSELSNHSAWKLKGFIDQNLRDSPPNITHALSEYRHLIFDGTFLHRPKSIAALMDPETKTIISGKYGISESSIPQLKTFFQPLKQKGLNPISCTIDGNPHVFKILKQLWPDIIIQRCLVHIQRQGLSWCRRFPKRTDAKHLRKIFMHVCHIDSHFKKQRFIAMFIDWEKRFGLQIKSQAEHGKVFSDIKRARSMLQKAIPNMFHYLDDSNIPKTTNALEGYYSRLKQHYRNHRGLSKDNLNSYFNWYFYLRPK